MKKIFQNQNFKTMRLLLGLAVLFLMLGVGFSFQDKKHVFSREQEISIKKVQADLASGEKYSQDPVEIIFGGDVMLDRYIRQVIERRGGDFIWQKIISELQMAEGVVVNLEGPITSNESVSVNTQIGERNNYIFTFDSGVTDFLKDANIRAVNLGNNHILNFGSDGAKQTQKYLQEAGITFFGNFQGNSAPGWRTLEIEGLKIALVNFNQFSSGAVEKTLADLKEAQVKNDFVVLMPHWGNEYENYINEKQKELARRFIEAGADLVIGSHPHVVQLSETYQGRKIYYSLGNFIFDQYFSEETQKGLLVKAVFDKKNHSIDFQELRLNLNANGQVEIVR